MATHERWDAFVHADAHSSFCHLSGWRRIFTSLMGHEDRSIALSDAGGTVRAVLPLIRVRSRLFGHYLISMPFLNDGGPLGPREAIDELLARAADEARTSRADLLEIRSRGAPIDASHGLRRTDRKITVHLPLDASRDVNWRALPSKVRSQVKRAQKESLTAHFGPDQRDTFYRLFAEGMRRLGTPVLPRALFERIAQEFPNEVEFGVIRYGDEPIAAGCGFLWRDQFEITWASASRAHSRFAPNMLLYWEFMDRARSRGARVFDFGRCTPGSNTHAFKRQWNGADVALPWLQWSENEVDATPKQDRGLYRMASSCWSRLPQGVTNIVGPRLAVYLP